MKKLIAVLMALCLLCTAVAAFADAATGAKEERYNGAKFGMTMDEVIAVEGAAGKKDTEHTHGPVTFEELEYEDVTDAYLGNITIDRSYLFADGKLAAIRLDIDTKDISYEAVKEALAAFGELSELDLALLGNGIYAVDDDGTPEKNTLAIQNGDEMVVLELDNDGDDIDVTFVDLTAAYIK